MPRTITVTGYTLTPAGAAALAESRLTPQSDAYEVVGAYDKAQAAEPGSCTVLRRFTEAYPRHAADLMAYAYAHEVYGWMLSDPVEA